MAAVRNYAGVLREFWTEAVPLDGGAAEAIQTNLPYTGDQYVIDVVLAPVVAVGAPVLTLTYIAVAGILSGTTALQVVVANTAPPGNTATFTLQATRQHSSVQ